MLSGTNKSMLIRPRNGQNAFSWINKSVKICPNGIKYFDFALKMPNRAAYIQNSFLKKSTLIH